MTYKKQIKTNELITKLRKERLTTKKSIDISQKYDFFEAETAQKVLTYYLEQTCKIFIQK